MSENKNLETEAVPEPNEPSAKRKFAATATSVAVTTVLTVGASWLIDQLGKKVADLIVPDNKN
jgi:hypothetical protein